MAIAATDRIAVGPEGVSLDTGGGTLSTVAALAAYIAANLGAAVGTSLAVTENITTSGGGIGYTGGGSTATQQTSKATTISMDVYTGAINVHAANLNAATSVSFTFTNSKIAATDVPVVAIKSGGTLGAYQVWVSSVSAGSCTITIRNTTAGALAEAFVLNFVNFKAVATA